MSTQPIIIVESDPVLSEAIGGLLESRGMRALLFRDPQAAIREVWETPTQLVVLEMTKPAFDAALVCRALKQEAAPPKILIVATQVAVAHVHRIVHREHRPDHRLFSPHTPAAVVAEIERILPRQEPASSQPPAPKHKSFLEILAERSLASSTGVLEINAGDTKTTVYLLNGEPIFADGGVLDDTLGRLLAKKGRLTTAQIGHAINLMQARKGKSAEMRLGEVLIEQKLLSAVEVHEAIREQVHKKIMRCFQWEQIEHRFIVRSDFIKDIGIFKRPISPVILEGIQRHYDVKRASAFLLPHLAFYPLVSESVAAIASRFQLNAQQQRFLRDVSGTRTVEDLRDHSNLDPLAASHLLTALLALKVLQLRTDGGVLAQHPREVTDDLVPVAVANEPSAAQGQIVTEYLRIKGKSDAQVLELEDTATTADIEQAFSEKAEGYIPERAMELPVELARRAVEIYARLRMARENMLASRLAKLAHQRKMAGPAPVRATSLPTSPHDDSRTEAEACFHHGKQLLLENTLVAALKEFRNAVSLFPNGLEYALYEAYVEYLLASDDGSRKGAKEKARRVAEKTVAQDPKQARAHAILGHFLRLEGDLQEAERHYRIAIASDRGDSLAQAGLRMLSQRADDKKKKPSG
jgi:DNA-binding response OmpR family regulator/tetratricopeptide (TPR) repeat protein